jgi:hypothetical protein
MGSLGIQFQKTWFSMEFKLISVKKPLLNLQSIVNTIRLAIIAVLLVGCNKVARQAKSDGFKGVQPAKAGNMTKNETTNQVRTAIFKPKLAPGLPDVIVLNSQNMPVGNLTVTGSFSSIDSSHIAFESSAGLSYSINMAFPKNMKPPIFGKGPGSMMLFNGSSPGAANESFALLRNNKLVLGFFWFTGNGPITFSINGSAAVQQLPVVNIPSQGRTVKSTSQARSDSGFTTIQPDSNVNYIRNHAPYQAYIISLYRSVPKGIADEVNGYILHGMIISRIAF